MDREIGKRISDARKQFSEFPNSYEYKYKYKHTHTNIIKTTPSRRNPGTKVKQQPIRRNSYKQNPNTKQIANYRKKNNSLLLFLWFYQESQLKSELQDSVCPKLRMILTESVQAQFCGDFHTDVCPA